jgi:hypothetical protein
MINNVHHIEHKIQISIIYITHGMKLHTLSFFDDGMLKMTKIGRNVLPSNIIAVIIYLR